MPSLNKVFMIGNLGADPELRYTANGNAILNFRLALHRRYKGADGEWKEDTTWVPIVVWNEAAERASGLLGKGSLCFVEGRWQTRSWDKDGQKRYMTEVVAEKVTALSKSSLEEDLYLDEGGLIEPNELPFA